MKNQVFPLLLALVLTIPAIADDEFKISLQDDGKLVTVKVGNQLFTRFDYTSYKKPIFYPVFGPGQLAMTRNHPMVKNVRGEASDHPHHKSMWLGHEINGVDFWSEKGGSVKSTNIRLTGKGFIANHQWLNDNNGEVLFTDQVKTSFGADRNSRFIDYQIEFNADSHPIIFEDTKEGTFALRVHPNLRATADKQHGSGNSIGKMKNSNGNKGRKIWGEKAKWVSYSGMIDGKYCSVTVLDHPDNLRHPTTWHARDYGLLAANPFGVHYFQRQPKGQGKYTVPIGKSLRLRYRVIFHAQELSDENIDLLFKQFSTAD